MRGLAKSRQKESARSLALPEGRGSAPVSGGNRLAFFERMARLVHAPDEYPLGAHRTASQRLLPCNPFGPWEFESPWTHFQVSTRKHGGTEDCT
jgi:hypothetical protein